MIIKQIFILIFISVSLTVISQENETVKKLQAKLQANQNEDTTEVNILNDLAWEYAYFDPRKSIAYSYKSIALSKKLNFIDGEGFAYNTIGDNYRSLAGYDSAFYFFDKALALRKQQNNKKKIAAVLLNTANVYTQQKSYANAIVRYKEVIKLGEEIDYKKLILVALTNLADAYRSIGSFDKGMETLEKALSINKILNDTVQLPYLYVAMAQLQFEMENHRSAIANAEIALNYLKNSSDVYLRTTALSGMGSYYAGLGQVDSALAFHFMALEIEKQMNDSIGLAVTTGNISKMYGALQKFDLAVSYAENARTIAKNIKDTVLYYSGTVFMATFLAENKEYKKALGYATEAFALIKPRNNKRDLQGIYYIFSKIYKELKQPQKQAEYMELYSQYKDSVSSEENNFSATKLNIEFDVYGKEKEIELLNKTGQLQEAELTKQKEEKIFITGIASLFGLIVIVIIFFYFKIKKTNAIINKQKERVEKQNDIITAQKHLVEEKQNEIISSINYAKRIQSAVLTGDDTWKRVSKDYFILFKPKDIVSGDFYWAHVLPNGRAVFALADCTGHGVPGGFMSMLGNSFLNEIVVENKIFNAAAILNRLREKIIKALEQKGQTEQKDGMDIALCVWNKMDNTLEFAGANNNLYLIRENKLQEFKGNKMPIGTYVTDNTAFTSLSIHLQKNDTLYITTDGFPDQFGGPNGKKYKYKQLEAVILAIQDLPMDQQCEILEKDIEEWRGMLEQVDDIAVIGIKV